jgi:ERCC4-type nuclease
VADFVLSSRLAVERKNVDTNDLHSSLESGRLWTQLRALGAAYSTPTLLVEFRDRSHRLDAPTTYLSLKHT